MLFVVEVFAVSHRPSELSTIIPYIEGSKYFDPLTQGLVGG